MPIKLFMPFALFVIVLLQGCLYSTHHFNRASLTPKAQSSWTLGTGNYRLNEKDCPEEYVKNDTLHTFTGRTIQNEQGKSQYICVHRTQIPDTSSYYNQWVYTDEVRNIPEQDTHKSIRNYSLGYRLGLWDSLWVFTGLDFGLHIEAPTNPISVEYDLRLGLPSPTPYFKHTISAGVQGGFWHEYTRFVEYAVAVEYKKQSLYGGFSYYDLADQLPSDSTYKGKFVMTGQKEKSWHFFGGLALQLPPMVFLPDVVYLETTIIGKPIAASSIYQHTDGESFSPYSVLQVGWQWGL